MYTEIQVFMVVTMKIAVFWDVTPYSVADCYRHFGRMCCNIMQHHIPLPPKKTVIFTCKNVQPQIIFMLTVNKYKFPPAVHCKNISGLQSQLTLYVLQIKYIALKLVFLPIYFSPDILTLQRNQYTHLRFLSKISTASHKLNFYVSMKSIK